MVYENVKEPACGEIGVTFENSGENSFVVSWHISSNFNSISIYSSTHEMKHLAHTKNQKKKHTPNKLHIKLDRNFLNRPMGFYNHRRGLSKSQHATSQLGILMTTAKTQTMQINKGHRSSRGKWSDQSCEFLKWMIKRACIDSSPLKAHLSTILKLRTAYIIKNPCARCEPGNSSSNARQNDWKIW